jgi:TolA-binding protein
MTKSKITKIIALVLITIFTLILLINNFLFGSCFLLCWMLAKPHYFKLFNLNNFIEKHDRKMAILISTLVLFGSISASANSSRAQVPKQVAGVSTISDTKISDLEKDNVNLGKQKNDFEMQIKKFKETENTLRDEKIVLDEKNSTVTEKLKEVEKLFEDLKSETKKIQSEKKILQEQINSKPSYLTQAQIDTKTTTVSESQLPSTVDTNQSKAEKTSVYFSSCSDARSNGYSRIKRGEPGYRAGLDRDNDGIACE